MKIFLSIAPSAVSTNGFAAGVTGAGPWTPSTRVSGDGLAHNVTIKNNTANNHSAKTLTVTGLDPNGVAQSETLAAPGISATVTTTKYYSYLTTVAIDATIGADTFDIGWAQTCVSWDIPLNPEVDYLPVFQAGLTGTMTWNLQTTLVDRGDQTYVNRLFNTDSNFNTKSGSLNATALALRARWLRVQIASYSSTPTLLLFGAVPL